MELISPCLGEYFYTPAMKRATALSITHVRPYVHNRWCGV